jgi:hypothetical protein
MRAANDSRWIAALFAAAAVVLVPWVALLVKALPSTHTAPHWDIAWGGFDTLLALLLLAVAISSWRRSAWLEGTAAAAATLLVADAWFDILTASTGTERAVALVEAIGVELPLAAFCLLIARRAERQLTQPVAAQAPVATHWSTPSPD